MTDDNRHEVKLDPETAAETIERLCALLGEVHQKHDGYSEPCDCICLARKRDPKYWRSTGDALRFIERTVRTALDAEPVPEELPSNATGEKAE